MQPLACDAPQTHIPACRLTEIWSKLARKLRLEAADCIFSVGWII